MHLTTTRRRLFLALSTVLDFTFTSKDSTHVHLGQVLVEAEGSHARFVATDGHSLCRITVPAPFDATSSFGWPAADVKRAIGLLKGPKATHGQDVTLSRAADGTVTLETQGGAMTSPSNAVSSRDGFPPYGQVIPERKLTKATHVVGCSPKLMMRCAKAFATMGSDQSLPSMSIQPGTSELDPILMTQTNLDGIETTVVLMPMRL